MENKEESYTQQ